MENPLRDKNACINMSNLYPLHPTMVNIEKRGGETTLLFPPPTAILLMSPVYSILHHPE